MVNFKDHAEASDRLKAEPTQEVIERTARTVADALDVNLSKDMPHEARMKWLSDPRTLARYFVHIIESKSPLDSLVMGLILKLWKQALTEPMAAIIALVESVGDEGCSRITQESERVYRERRDEIAALRAQLALENTRIKAIVKKCDAYAAELHDLKNTYR